MWATLVKMFSCFFHHDSQPWKLRFYTKNLIFVEKSPFLVHFCKKVLHVKWNLACPITVHFIFLMLPQIQKLFLVDILSLLLVRPKIFINITSGVFHCHAPGKKSPVPCNDQLWCPHMQLSWHPTETSDLVVYDHLLSTSMLKKTSSIGFRNWEYGGRNSTVILLCAANQKIT